MSTWIQAFGTLQDFSTDCSKCHGRHFLERGGPNALSPFIDASNQRCPCWLVYTAAHTLYENSFPRGYLAWNWDSCWPRSDSDKDAEIWLEKHPNSYIWKTEEQDMAALRFWVEEADQVFKKGFSLLLMGPKGVGKTSLATVLAKEYVKRVGLNSSGVESWFTALFLVSDALYEAVGVRGRAQAELTAQAADASILVIDDLRMAYVGYVQTEYIERIHSILQHRASNNLPTIITANKIEEGSDFKENSVTQFLGISQTEVPARWGKYRYIRLTNEPLRAEPEWPV